MKYIQRITRITVLPEGDSLFSELATHIEIEDEAAGEFLIVEQEGGKLKIDPSEWPTLKDAIDRMLKECRAPEAEEISGEDV